MSVDFAVAEPDGPLFRLGRRPDAWAWPDWVYAGPDGTFGNRYDDPRASYRVLYACSQRRGAFFETLSRFRPDLDVVAELGRIDGDPEPAARLPRAWLTKRVIGQAMLQGRYVEIANTRTLATLRVALAAEAIDSGLDDIDAATIRLAAPREFTQHVSRYLYEQHPIEEGPFAGIRYRSRLGDEIANWAIFEPAPGTPDPLRATTSRPIDPGDPDLHVALELLGLQLD